ncbi:MAG: MarR family transcriptional regulator [Frankiales bacterium]|nr:MarR family transcriptional regulator [Frankiales bacterium]
MSPASHPLEQLVDEVLRTSGRLLAATASAATGGLTGSQHVVLSAVVRAERPPTVPQIGRSLGHSRQAVQRLADVLVDRGLVCAVENPDHKRARCLVATTAGRELYAESDRRSRDWGARVTRDLTAAQIDATVQTLRTLRHNLEADASSATPPSVRPARPDVEEARVGLQH